MTNTCGGCDGVSIVTPRAIAHRPGLSTLPYRIGTHASFQETMQARLSSGQFPALKQLTTRDVSDPAIAFLDAWATVADVLTFYQERIANEGYLRTATERRSILELARLVGYRLRPGVASSVYLAFTLDEGYDNVEIPRGTRCQSLPAPGELPQSFETSEVFQAKGSWNALKPRMSRPQEITLVSDQYQSIDPLQTNADILTRLYFKGTTSNLKPSDTLLLVFGDGNNQQLTRRVKAVEPVFAEDHTLVTLQVDWDSSSFVRAIQRLAQRYGDIGSFCVSAADAFVKEALEILTAWQPPSLQEGSQDYYYDEALLSSFSDGVARLVAYREAAIATVGPYQRSVVWFKSLIAEIESIVNDLPTWLKNNVIGNGFDVYLTRPRPASSYVAGASFEGGENGGGLVLPGITLPPVFFNLTSLVSPLIQPPSLQPANTLRLNRSVAQTFKLQADTTPQILAALQPAFKAVYQTWGKAFQVEATKPVEIYALRTVAPLFGHNARREPKYNANGQLLPQAQWDALTLAGDEATNCLALDQDYAQIQPGSYIVVKSAFFSTPQIFRAESVETFSREAYGLSGKTTLITLPSGQTWRPNPPENVPTNYFNQIIRSTTVYAQSERLDLAEEPIPHAICSHRIELDALYEGLKSGQWLALSGERIDVPQLKATELVMLSGVEQSYDPDLPGDKPHSTITLANAPAYPYRRDTVTLMANVVKATHGETQAEVLGSGNSSKILQQFALRKPPLTHLPAPTAAGAASTLEVRVNDIRWHEANTLVGLGPRDRQFITQQDDEGKTSLIFGNGEAGARLPSGQENVKAVYRSGSGKVGNVKADQISLLGDRPLGVRSVINPVGATGGADAETRDQARRHAPLAVMALDRLVSVQDYQDFCRTFAGIGKASARRLSNGRQEVVHITIAGADDIPIDANSDLYRNLRQALHQLGDPFQPIEVAVRELKLVVLVAKVKLLADYQWETVEPMIRRALLDAFSFDQRELGQDITLSEAISTIQGIAGVAFVDLDVLDGIAETTPPADLVNLSQTLQGADQPKPRIVAELARPNPSSASSNTGTTSILRPILPAQLAFLSPDVPDTLILQEWKS